jgi:IS30 family transposase
MPASPATPELSAQVDGKMRHVDRPAAQEPQTRLPRTRCTARKGGLPNITNISLRPPEVAARIVPGHWEGDLILNP